MTLVDGIYSKLSMNEIHSHAMQSGLSTFQADTAAMSYMIRYATKNSLCLCDEYGKGTNSKDGRYCVNYVALHCFGLQMYKTMSQC
jgi:DNA mismatch repair ATPase MutS